MAFLEGMTRFLSLLFALFSIGLSACSQAPDASHARIAVATNFQPVMEKLAAQFETRTNYRLETVTGSTGLLYAQIINGAPYDVFLAADEARPQNLSANGQGVAGTRFTYALGQLVLWHPEKTSIGPDNLKAAHVRKVALANPELAPYGLAAAHVIDGLGLTVSLKDKRVLGENIGQTFAFVKTGNAALGFVALSQVLGLPEGEQGAYWMPPQRLYTPIRQDAILLKRGQDNAQRHYQRIGI